MERLTERLAVVLARGGSKRLPGKNVRLLGGKPLIAWSIEAAVASGLFTRVLVSTDDTAIARVAEAAGGWAPFRRPAELSSDEASSDAALLHAVDWYCNEGPHRGFYVPDLIVLLQPTSPFTTSGHLVEAIALFERGRFDTLSSMRAVRDRPEWMFLVSAKGDAKPLEPERVALAGRDCAARFIENGAIYVIKTEWLRREKSLYNFSRHGAYLMPANASIDIDTIDDWNEAERLLAAAHVSTADSLRTESSV